MQPYVGGSVGIVHPATGRYVDGCVGFAAPPRSRHVGGNAGFIESAQGRHVGGCAGWLATWPPVEHAPQTEVQRTPEAYIQRLAA